jgi:NTP pyrophosphatase (non-canonical NTP hydrolase)
MRYKELEPLVIQWAKEKGILEKATPTAQALKTEEEVEELIEACVAQKLGEETFTNSKGNLVNTREEILDAFGDIMVTIIIGAELQGLKLEDCLESAYNVISKRTGKMVNGQFLKRLSMNYYYDPLLGLQYNFIGNWIVMNIEALPKDLEFDVTLWKKYINQKGISFLTTKPEELVKITDYML